MFLLQQKQSPQRGARKLWEVPDIPVTLTVVMVSQVFAYVQNHQIGHIEYVQLFAYQLYFSKEVLKTQVSNQLVKKKVKKRCL